jgi:HK97 gp10 family phage protein
MPTHVIVNNNLGRLANLARAEVAKELEAAGKEMAAEIKAGFHEAKHGTIYERAGQSHQASAPGETPASDSGDTEASIEVSTDLQGGKIVSQISAGTEYAVDLELGTINMLPRPIMRPAAEKQAQELPKRVAGAIRRAAQAAKVR